jgi:hypothetical protein
MKRQIKFYSINERFDFGKYKGRTVLGVARDNPGYINWCLETVSFFIMDEKTIKDHDDYDHDDFPYHKRKTFEEYRGSYAQDVAGFSDQDIDDIFGGEPDAYWNIN